MWKRISEFFSIFNLQLHHANSNYMWLLINSIEHLERQIMTTSSWNDISWIHLINELYRVMIKTFQRKAIRFIMCVWGYVNLTSKNFVSKFDECHERCPWLTSKPETLNWRLPRRYVRVESYNVREFGPLFKGRYVVIFMNPHQFPCPPYPSRLHGRDHQHVCLAVS